MEKYKSMLDKLDEILSTEEGRKDIQDFFAKKELEREAVQQRVNEKHVEISLLSDEAFQELVKGLKDPHEGWTDKQFQKGIIGDSLQEVSDIMEVISQFGEPLELNGVNPFESDKKIYKGVTIEEFSSGMGRFFHVYIDNNHIFTA